MIDKYTNLRTIILKLVNDPDIIHIAQSKNVSELIKLLPIIGSWIENQTIGRIRDRELEKRLNEIENSFDNVVSINDGYQILELIQSNSNLIYNFIAHFQDELLKNNEKQKLELRKTMLIPRNSKKILKPSNSFHFVIISGASATGKDAILNKVVAHNYKGFSKKELLIKYTTRKKRESDALYYKFVKEKKYNKLFNDDKIIFPFSKRKDKYGFDKIQLSEAVSENKILFCIYTEFESLYHAKRMLDELGVANTFILLEANLDELIDRSWGRNFDINEITTRINSIKQDIEFIEQNNELIKEIFDYRIYSGDEKAKNDLIREVIMAIEKDTTANTLYKQ